MASKIMSACFPPWHALARPRTWSRSLSAAPRSGSRDETIAHGTFPSRMVMGFFQLGFRSPKPYATTSVNQPAHHQKLSFQSFQSFQDEFRLLLRRYKIDHDKRY